MKAAVFLRDHEANINVPWGNTTLYPGVSTCIVHKINKKREKKCENKASKIKKFR